MPSSLALSALSLFSRAGSSFSYLLDTRVGLGLCQGLKTNASKLNTEAFYVQEGSITGPKQCFFLLIYSSVATCPLRMFYVLLRIRGF